MDYYEKSAKKALEKLSKIKGIPLVEIKKEIQIAIDDAMKIADPKAQALWNKMNYKGDKPTPEEVIAFLSAKAREE